MGDVASDCFESLLEETIPDSFICCVCLDLLYKPIVLDCGHVSCFWCVHKSMDHFCESHCPICRHAYHHFPTICEMLHFLLLKMYPVAYNSREKQILAEEKAMKCFSPQLDGKELYSMPSGPCVTSEGKDCSNMDGNGSAAIKESNFSAINNDRTCKRVSIADVLCPVCEQLLFRPAVLNCGHVYCEGCITVTEDGIVICKVCESPHPSDCPNVCLEFNNFLEEQFPEEYEAQRQNVEQKKARFQHESPSCPSSKKSAKKGSFKLYGTNEESLPWWNEHGSKIHMSVGCDNCGMFPMVGDRYRCQDCVEKMGFDLCGDCYNTRSKRPGRFNQQHTPDHRFELVKHPDVLLSPMLHLVGRHLVDSSGAELMAMNADEETPDDWISIQSSDPLPIIDDDEIPESDHDDIMHEDDDTQDGSVLEVRDAS